MIPNKQVFEQAKQALREQTYKFAKQLPDILKINNHLWQGKIPTQDDVENMTLMLVQQLNYQDNKTHYDASSGGINVEIRFFPSGPNARIFYSPIQVNATFRAIQEPDIKQVVVYFYQHQGVNVPLIIKIEPGDTYQQTKDKLLRDNKDRKITTILDPIPKDDTNVRKFALAFYHNLKQTHPDTHFDALQKAFEENQF
jgi:hypothetical protein